ncbi:pyrimidine-specific ribonucleoside hydrolase RihA-like [Dermacentor variabilis]|uniref:pyrimidine-specific ribonucleoside hydrolase RihA-like n=1 Tax=Dermacentor variabilis TaxID=34621 RepID=UPI003F5B93DE
MCEEAASEDLPALPPSEWQLTDVEEWETAASSSNPADQIRLVDWALRVAEGHKLPDTVYALLSPLTMFVLMWTSISLACAALFLAGNADAVLSTAQRKRDTCVRLLLDVDPGVDDALAITLAATHRNVCLEAITVVAGNADLQTGYNNTLRTLRVVDRTNRPIMAEIPPPGEPTAPPGVDIALDEASNRRWPRSSLEAAVQAPRMCLFSEDLFDTPVVPVYKGADRSLDGYGRTEKKYFGLDNFGGVSAQYPMSTNPACASKTPGYIKMIKLVKKYPGQLTLVFTGPLTNLAIALLSEPEIAKDIKHVYIMGGTLYAKGNVIPAAEFNFFTDPEAAFIVLQRATWYTQPDAFLLASLPNTMNVLCLSHSQSTYYSLTNTSGPLQQFLRDTTNHTVQCCLSGDLSPDGFSAGDFLAVLAAAVPDSVTRTVQNRVSVERCGAYTRGQLVHAWEPKILPHVRRNVTIVESFDVDIVEEYFNYTFDPIQT